MALNKQTLQTLDSPRLRPLNMRGLVGLTAGQLRKQVEAEKQEIGQLRNQLNAERAAILDSSESSMGVGLSAIELPQNLSERQALVRELQQLREEKLEIVEQIKALRTDPGAALRKSVKAAERLEKEIKKRKREEEKKRKKEEKKDKIWNKKNLRKGSVSGEKAHDRFQRYFDSKKISDADKDRLRSMLNDISFYESDEVFQLLSLMESKAFNNLDEAEEFLTDFYHIKKGQSAALERFEDGSETTDFEAAAGNIENMAEDFEVNTGLGLRF